MRNWLSGLAVLCALSAHAQQGYLPLSRTVDAPWTALMHRWKAPGHAAIRPYLREDLKQLPGTDSLLPPAAFPWLQRITDPTHRLSGGPLVDGLLGASTGETDPVKYRAGIGGWLDWSATDRLTFHLDGQVWGEALPNYLDSIARANRSAPGEGLITGRPGSSVSHYDWSASVDYRAGDYIHLTLGRGKNFFGEGYRSLFLSDEAYSYPYFRITTTAWHIRYVNLFALMDDIRGAGTDPRRFGKKFTSMHYLSWNVSKRLNVGLFESIVWQDNDPKYPRGFDLSYVNPVIFYRPVEFGLGSPDNALLGFAVNVKVGRQGLLYTQLMLDEFLLKNVKSGLGWFGNKQGVQVGAVVHNAFGRKGLTVRGEFNYIRPFMYTHTDTRQNYSHHGQPLAHPYGSNCWEALAQGEWRSKAWLLSGVISYAYMGQDTGSAGRNSYGNNIFRPEGDRPPNADFSAQNYGYFVGTAAHMTVLQSELRIGRLIEPRSGLMLEAAWTFRTEDRTVGADLATNYIRLGISANIRERHPFQTVRYKLP